VSRWFHEWWPLLGAAALMAGVVLFAKYGGQQ